MLKALIDVQRWSRKCDGRHCLPGITLQLKTQTVNRDNILQVAGYLRATKKSKAGKGVGEGMARDGLEGLSKEVPLVQKPEGQTGASHPSTWSRLDQAGATVQGP